MQPAAPERLELNLPDREREEKRAFGWFECGRPNEMWTGDTLHGPVIAGRKPYLLVTWNPSAEGSVGRRPSECSHSLTTIPAP
jgi:putative transposase